MSFAMMVLDFAMTLSMTELSRLDRSFPSSVIVNFQMEKLFLYLPALKAANGRKS
jgi:hypothetical protein